MPLGLRPNVEVLQELGFVYLDDGNSTLRLRSSLMDRIRSGTCHAESPEYEHLGPYVGVFFTDYSNEQAALASMAYLEVAG